MTIESTLKERGASSHQEGGDHYAKMQEDMQPWNVLSHWLTPEEYRGYQKGVAIAYLAREASKGGNMDIRKAIHHLQRLVEEFPAHQETSSAKSLDLPVVELPASMRCGDDVVKANAQYFADGFVVPPYGDGFCRWCGGEQPEDTKDKVVHVKFRCGETGESRADSLAWEHSSDGYDIVAYKVV